jgi:hypothetical protein
VQLSVWPFSPWRPYSYCSPVAPGRRRSGKHRIPVTYFLRCKPVPSSARCSGARRIEVRRLVRRGRRSEHFEALAATTYAEVRAWLPDRRPGAGRSSAIVADGERAGQVVYATSAIDAHLVRDVASPAGDAA